MRHIRWTSSSPARGIQLLAGTFTDANTHPSWTVTVQAPTQSPFDSSAELAEAGSRAWASQTVAALAADGFTPCFRSAPGAVCCPPATRPCRESESTPRG